MNFDETTINNIIGKLILSGSFKDFPDTDYSFFGHLLYQMKKKVVKFGPDCMGAGISVKGGDITLYYDPETLKENISSEAQLAAVLLHEICHVILNHCTTRSGDRTPLDNVAADLAIHGLYPFIPKVLKNGLVPGEGSFKDFPPNLSKEEYLDLLKKHEFKVKYIYVYSPDGQEAGKTSTLPDIDKSELGRMVIRESIKDAALKSQGKLPAGLEDIINRWLKVKAPDWKHLVKQSVSFHLKATKKLTKRKEHRRYGDAYPGVIKHRLPKILIAFDTSASMSDRDLAEAVGFINNLLRDFPQGKFDVIDCDTEAVRTQLTKKQLFRKTKFVGRGGTDFVPIFKESERVKDDIIIIFTDLYGEFPDRKPRIPTIWVTKTDIKPPFGKVVKMVTEEER